MDNLVISDMIIHIPHPSPMYCNNNIISNPPYFEPEGYREKELAILSTIFSTPVDNPPGGSRVSNSNGIHAGVRSRTLAGNG